MNTEIANVENSSVTPEVMEELLAAGDLSKLNTKQRVEYYTKTCESLGLNPLTRPFDYLKLNNKTVLYVKKEATDQLRSLRKISLCVVSKELTGDLIVVTVRASTPDGRVDEDMGSVNMKGLYGENLSNAMMKAITKAKRRVTLSICGLGWIDDSEVDSIKNAERLPEKVLSSEIVEHFPKTIQPETAMQTADDLENLRNAFRTAKWSTDEAMPIMKHYFNITNLAHLNKLTSHQTKALIEMMKTKTPTEVMQEIYAETKTL